MEIITVENQVYKVIFMVLKTLAESNKNTVKFD